MSLKKAWDDSRDILLMPVALLTYPVRLMRDSFMKSSVGSKFFDEEYCNNIKGKETKVFEFD